MKAKIVITWIILAISVGISFLAIAFLVNHADAQTQTIDNLNRLLLQKGIPIKSISTVKQSPFIVKIAIQSASHDKNLKPEDLYFKQIARKAATLFYRHGHKIDGYELETINLEGISNSWESNHVIPGEFSQQNSLSPLSKISDTDTENILKSTLKLNGLVLKTISVTTDQYLGDSGQELVLQLKTEDIKTSNQFLIPFLLSLHDTLDDVNKNYETKIVLCWLRVFDHQGNLLLNYIWDVETREGTSIQAPGIAAWYPVPYPVPTNLKTPSSKTLTANPRPQPNDGGSQGYPPPITPVPTPFLTPRPYP